MIQPVEMNFEETPISTFIEQLFDEKQYLQIRSRKLLESIELKADDGRILRIYDGELRHFYQRDGEYELKLIVENKMDWKIWFEITMTFDRSKKFIRQLEFSQWIMKVKNNMIKIYLINL